MPTLTKEIEDAIRINAREGFADELIALSKQTYETAIKYDNAMHIGSVNDEEQFNGFEQTTVLIKIARDLGIDNIDWIKWHIVISPVKQQPVIFIEINFNALMKQHDLCSSYTLENIDEADEVTFDPISGDVIHNVAGEPLGNITGSYVKCIFEHKKTELPLLIQFDVHERIKAESLWEYQVIGMGEKIDVIGIALNLRLLKHAGDRMNILKGKDLFEAIQKYYTTLFYHYEEAQRDANRYTKQTRGVHIGDPEIEADLRNRLRHIDAMSFDSQQANQNVVNFPEPDNGFDDAFDWLAD